MSWSADQQVMLEAMGYTLWRRPGAPVPVPAAVLAPPPPPAPGEVEGRPVGAASARVADPLLRALQRAAGDGDLAALQLPPLDLLRRDAAAKRALWPRLRALRRRR